MSINEIFRDVAPKLRHSFNDHSLRYASCHSVSATSFMAQAFASAFGTVIVHVSDGPQSLDTAHRNMLTLAPNENIPPLYYPALESLDPDCADPEITGYRLNLMQTLLSGAKDGNKHIVIATCIQALLQKTPNPEYLKKNSLTFLPGDTFDPEKINPLLLKLNYQFTPKVFNKCEISVRGGIIDIWPPHETWPVRIELFGNEIDSMRIFDPTDQRSISKKDSILIMPANNTTNNSRQTGTLLSYLPENSIFIWSDYDSIMEYAATYENTIAESGLIKSITTQKKLISAISKGHAYRQIIAGNISTAQDSELLLEFSPVRETFDTPDKNTAPDEIHEKRSRLIRKLEEQSKNDSNVVLCFNTQGALDHFRNRYYTADATQNQAPDKTVHAPCLHLGFLSDGFTCESLGVTIVAETDLYGYHKILDQRYHPFPSKSGPQKDSGSRITDLSNIEPDDLVVHAEYGLGRYLGVFEITFDGKLREALTIEYADNAKLHVPVSHMHLLSRYVGTSKTNVKLHRLGGSRWKKEKQNASDSIVDLAAALLEVQAHRDLLKGHSFKHDSPWQMEFEASFPYHETTDQRNVIARVKGDMESSHPMDRLICGDAGYGKTEVAMRAAFKSVMENKQVAVLVPTTVLALQHYQTFTDRMAPYPVRIEMLSRFCSKKRHDTTIRDMAEGKIDIVIGTHALLQPSIKFKDLGLVIIDEEQRFGVTNKEHFKHLRKLIDVLTLTATPIPRTLYMSMTGARDISLLQTPPRERISIKTIVAKKTDEVIREAIIREINREGQVFYLHNRVATIENVMIQLERIVPEARIRIGHGQMSSGELSSVMEDFTSGKFDVLLCTTIIESGMDIPRANTILIDRADRFGIADLYQLRGRVGRSSKQAYAYLLLPSHGNIESDARKRIAAIKKYSGLSTGFSLALRDLEIRGAGNMLGAEQSGHISAIGFSLYCQLLKQTIARLKGEPLPTIVDVTMNLDFISFSANQLDDNSAAVIPYEYIEDEPLRIELYKKLAEIVSSQEITKLQEELTDQYGAIPISLLRLLKLAELRMMCASKGISSIETRSDKLIMQKGKDYLKSGDHFPRLKKITPDDKLDEITSIISTI